MNPRTVTVADLMTFDLEQLRTWLQWNDPNGEYAPDDYVRNEWPAPTREGLLDVAIEQLVNGNWVVGE